MVTEEKKTELLAKLRNAVIQYDEDTSKEASQEALDVGMEANDAIFNGLVSGMVEVVLPELVKRQLSIGTTVVARQGALRLPLRWFAIPQCWRYERMTRGRRREHYQWNMDVWGEAEARSRDRTGPPSRLRRYGAASFAWLAEPKLTLRLCARERRMVDQTGIEPVTS